MKNIAVLMEGLLKRIFHKKQRVSNALRKLGHNVIRLDVDENMENLTSRKIDLAYIALHRKDGRRPIRKF